MAIKIQTKTTKIPVVIGDLEFEFDTSDESIKNFDKSATEVMKELDKIKVDQEDETSVEAVKDVLKRGFDLFLGDGAFDKIYEVSPSVVIVMQYFEQVAEGITEELNKMNLIQTSEEKVQKYLQHKKK